MQGAISTAVRQEARYCQTRTDIFLFLICRILTNYSIFGNNSGTFGTKESSTDLKQHSHTVLDTIFCLINQLRTILSTSVWASVTRVYDFLMLFIFQDFGARFLKLP